MYFFVDTNGENGRNQAPVENLTYNGVDIGLAIDSFRVLYVQGRNSMNVEIETSETIPGRDGKIPYEMTIPPREITVGYQLRAKSPAHMNYCYDRLKRILLPDREDHEIRFFDEHFSYFGRIRAVTEPPSGRLFVNGEFTFYCPDPYKYSDRREQDLAGIFKDRESWGNDIHLEKIELVSEKDCSIRNETSGQQINVKDKGEIVLDFLNARIKKKGADITSKLAFESSDFPDFSIRNRDEITSSGKSGKIYYRLKRL